MGVGYHCVKLKDQDESLDEDCSDGEDDEDGDDDVALVVVLFFATHAPEVGVGEEVENLEDVEHVIIIYQKDRIRM